MQLFHDTKPNQLPPYLPPMPLLLTAAPHLIMLLPPFLPPSLQLPSALPPSVIGTAHTDDGAASNGGGSRVFNGGCARNAASSHEGPLLRFGMASSSVLVRAQATDGWMSSSYSATWLLSWTTVVQYYAATH